MAYKDGWNFSQIHVANCRNDDDGSIYLEFVSDGLWYSVNVTSEGVDAYRCIDGDYSDEDEWIEAHSVWTKE